MLRRNHNCETNCRRFERFDWDPLFLLQFLFDGCLWCFHLDESSQAPPIFYASFWHRFTFLNRIKYFDNFVAFFVRFQVRCFICAAKRCWTEQKVFFAHSELTDRSLLSIYVITLFRSIAGQASGIHTLDTVPVSN